MYIYIVFNENSDSTTTVTVFCYNFQLCSSKSGISSVSQALLVKPMKINGHGMGKDNKRMKVKCMAASIPADDRVPDMEKRNLMNLLLLGALALPTGGMLVPYATFFAPPGLVPSSFPHT